MPSAIDLTGRRFGRLVALERANSPSSGKRWRCLCDCGASPTVSGACLRDGNTRSCGCLKSEMTAARNRATTPRGPVTHGMSYTPTYMSWKDMKSRCTWPDHPDFPAYGGRGISVSPAWLLFAGFFADMGERPEGTTLDRFPDQDGNYEPGNVRWATPVQQRRNRRDNAPVTYHGETLFLVDWAARLGLDLVTLWARIYRSGWSIDKAFTTPPRSTRGRESWIGM